MGGRNELTEDAVLSAFVSKANDVLQSTNYIPVSKQPKSVVS